MGNAQTEMAELLETQQRVLERMRALAGAAEQPIAAGGTAPSTPAAPPAPKRYKPTDKRYWKKWAEYQCKAIQRRYERNTTN